MLVLFLLLCIDFTIHSHCKTKINRVGGYVQEVLLNTHSILDIADSLHLPHCCLSDSSYYLPLRPGFNAIVRTYLTIINLNRLRNSLQQIHSKYNADYIFYIHAPKNLPVQLKLSTKGIISLYVNDKLIVKHLNKSFKDCLCVDNSCLNFKFGCIYYINKMLHIGPLWNKLLIANISYNTFIYLKPHLQCKITPFIPYRTNFKPQCEQYEKQAKLHIRNISFIKVDMAFTYGQKIGLDKLISCLHTLVLSTVKGLTLHGNLTLDYQFAIIAVLGTNKIREQFLNIIFNRKKSHKCFSYTCVWYLDNNLVNVANLTRISAKENVFNKINTYEPSISNKTLRNKFIHSSFDIIQDNISKPLKTLNIEPRCYAYPVSIKQNVIRDITVKLIVTPHSLHDIYQIKQCFKKVFSSIHFEKIDLRLNQNNAVVEVTDNMYSYLLHNKTNPCYNNVVLVCKKDYKYLYIYIIIIAILLMGVMYQIIQRLFLNNANRFTFINDKKKDELVAKLIQSESDSDENNLATLCIDKMPFINGIHINYTKVENIRNMPNINNVKSISYEDAYINSLKDKSRVSSFFNACSLKE